MAKGSVADLFLIGFVFMFALAIVAPIMFLVIDSVRTEAGEAGINTTAFDKGIMSLKVVDAGFIFFSVGVCVAAVLAAFMINTHPIYYYVTLILSIIMVYLSSLFSNIYEDVSTQASVASAYNEFSMMTLVMGNLPTILIVFSIFIAIAVYSRGRLT